ncbi:MAG: WecB/TagA/CpsF family glycosyltransferase [Oscillospiraceae bacterium]|nr:WecB/TagA/CpsF family glycosyltransferase [Oscillospiraceae bacterium]
MRVPVLGVEFDNVNMEEAAERCMELMHSPGFHYMVTPNPEIVWECRKDAELREIINGADVVTPDGIGIVLGARILGTPVKEKVGGADLTEELLHRLSLEGGTAYFLGAKPGIAEKAARVMEEKYPGLRIVGTGDGYFTDDGPVVEKINAAGPQLLLVCLGASKQEKWIKKYSSVLNARLAVGLGGSLDVYAGAVARAPESWQKLNLEWLYRLIKEPRRFKRQLRLPAFLFAVIFERLRGKKA